MELAGNSSREIQTSVSSAINNISNHSPPQVEKIRNKVDRSLKTQGLLLPAVTVNPSVIIPEEVYLRGVEMHTELISCFFLPHSNKLRVLLITCGVNESI